MLERFLDQIGEVLRLCEDTDGILVVNREGIIEYHRIPLNSYWCSQDTVGRHILELYPELDGESSTILTALRTGRASYNVLQDINNHRGERVLLESTTHSTRPSTTLRAAISVILSSLASSPVVSRSSAMYEFVISSSFL